MSLAEFRRKIRLATDAANKGIKYPRLTDAGDVPNTYQLRRPSGIMQLDIDTAGGLPAGGISYISGADGAGKTWLLYNYFAMHQRLYGEMASICYAPTEFLPDYMFMRSLGCRVSVPEMMLDQVDQDRKNMRMPKLTKAEREELRQQTGVFKLLRAPTSEGLLDGLLEIYERNVFHIIAVDSISVLLPSAEAALDSLGEFPQQAANASLVTRFLQHFHSHTQGLGAAPNITTLIFTSQMRANRKKSEGGYGAKYLPDSTEATGAYAARHGKLVDILLKSSTKEKAGPKDPTIAAKLLKWEIVKAKAGSHDNVVGEYTFRYDTPWDHIPHLVATAIQYGVAVENNGQLTFLCRNTSTPLPTKSGADMRDMDLNAVRTLFTTDPDAEMIVRREITAAAGVKTCLYI
jgi:RecA/RadA recombinase